MATIEYAVVNPATGEQLAHYDVISDDALRGAIGRAHSAHAGWKAMSVQERAAIIGRVAEIHEQRMDELGEIVVREMGKPLDQAVGEVEFAGAIYQYYADNAAAMLKDEPIELLDGEGSALIRRSSVGVLLGIMPWNYPFYQVARFAGPNLIAGNTILLKHAPQCPESSKVMEEIFQEAGVPADAYINIYASNEQIEWVIGDPRVRGVSLTGSGRAGAAVAEIAGRNLKKVVLELGGSDPFIVLSTDDMDAVVEAAIGARLENTGQACNAAKRFVVIDALYDEFVDKFTAAMTGAEVGPLSSELAADRLQAQVQQAVDGGAQITGGGREGNIVKTAVLTGITPGNPAYGEELFGPIAQVYRVTSEDEAIEVANDTPFGLGSYVFTTDAEQAMRVADQIDAGMVFINIVGADGVELPFGGTKASGFGRELGRSGIEEFLNKKLIRVGA